MIIRIVSLTIQKDLVEDFILFFRETEKTIRNFHGCLHLELLYDIAQPHKLVTYSHWQDEEALERYRASEIFREIWGQAKKYFSEKPLATSFAKYPPVKN